MKDPEKVRRRVLFVSAFNGWSLLVVAGLFTIASLLFGDGLGVLVGAAVLVSPWLELKARQRFQQNQAGARSKFLWSQAWLFAVIVAYALSQLILFHTSDPLQSLPTESVQALREFLMIDERGLRDFLGQIYLAVYLSVIVASFLYQGGLYLFYRRNVPAPDERTSV